MNQWVIWCELNAEQDLLEKVFGDKCVSIYGSLTSEEKERRLNIWLDKKVPIMISKTSIFGFGLNLQQCFNTAFVGLSDSFESVFQATKRFHRHGQKNKVTRHIIISEAEGAVLQNIQRKESEFALMIDNMVQHTRNIAIDNIKNLQRESNEYNADTPLQLPSWLKQGGY